MVKIVANGFLNVNFQNIKWTIMLQFCYYTVVRLINAPRFLPAVRATFLEFHSGCKTGRWHIRVFVWTAQNTEKEANLVNIESIKILKRMWWIKCIHCAQNCYGLLSQDRLLVLQAVIFLSPNRYLLFQPWFPI